MPQKPTGADAPPPEAPAESCAFDSHDHGHCRDTAMAEAASRCAAEGLRLTPARAHVLEILLESHQALGAYDVLERLGAEGARPQPPVAYRALDFLVKHGFAHRIEKLNAFVACAHPRDGAHAPVFFVCRLCRRVAETAAPAARAALAGAAASLGFKAEAQVLEVTGLCPDCLEREA